MSQTNKILSHLQAFGRITSKEAIDRYGITRLSGRIYDLRGEGHFIASRMVTVKNRQGEDTQVAEYRLVRKGQEQQSLEI